MRSPLSRQKSELVTYMVLCHRQCPVVQRLGHTKHACNRSFACCLAASSSPKLTGARNIAPTSDRAGPMFANRQRANAGYISLTAFQLTSRNTRRL